MVRIEVTDAEANMIVAALKFWAGSGGSENDALIEIATSGWSAPEMRAFEIEQLAASIPVTMPAAICKTCCAVSAYVTAPGNGEAPPVVDRGVDELRCEACGELGEPEDDRDMILKKLHAIHDVGPDNIGRDERGFFDNWGGRSGEERFATKDRAALHALGEEGIVA